MLEIVVSSGTDGNSGNSGDSGSIIQMELRSSGDSGSINVDGTDG